MLGFAFYEVGFGGDAEIMEVRRGSEIMGKESKRRGREGRGVGVAVL